MLTKLSGLLGLLVFSSCRGCIPEVMSATANIVEGLLTAKTVAPVNTRQVGVAQEMLGVNCFLTVSCSYTYTFINEAFLSFVSAHVAFQASCFDVGSRTTLQCCRGADSHSWSMGAPDGMISQVFLIVEPKFEWDADAVKRRERAVKRAKIATAELFRASPLDDTHAAFPEGQMCASRTGITVAAVDYLYCFLPLLLVQVSYASVLPPSANATEPGSVVGEGKRHCQQGSARGCQLHLLRLGSFYEECVSSLGNLKTLLSRHNFCSAATHQWSLNPFLRQLLIVNIVSFFFRPFLL